MIKKFILAILVIILLMLITTIILISMPKKEQMAKNKDLDNINLESKNVNSVIENVDNNIILNKDVTENKIINNTTNNTEVSTTKNINKNTTKSNKSTIISSKTTNKSNSSNNKTTTNLKNDNNNTTHSSNKKQNNTINNISQNTNKNTSAINSTAEKSPQNTNKKEEQKTIETYKVNTNMINKMKSYIESNPSVLMQQYGFRVVVDSSIVNEVNQFTYTEKRVKNYIINRFDIIKIFARDYYYNGEYVWTESFIL